MIEAFRNTFSNLEVLSLDPTHLAIVYEYSTWRKRSPGSSFLRELMAKSSVFDSAVSPEVWGQPYSGEHAKPLTR